MIYAIILFLTLLTCSYPKDECVPTYRYQDQTHYVFTVNQITTNGIRVDTTGQLINLNKIDRLTNEVEQCLTAEFNGVLPKEVIEQGQCIGPNFTLPINRECLKVKVPNDWFVSTYEYAGSKHQLLPAIAPDIGCLDKGLPAGDCHWRAAIQDNMTVVVPPSFYLYKDPLIRIVTGCNNPWNNPRLAACAKPSTLPLGEGNEE